MDNLPKKSILIIRTSAYINIQPVSRGNKQIVKHTSLSCSGIHKHSRMRKIILIIHPNKLTISPALFGVMHIRNISPIKYAIGFSPGIHFTNKNFLIFFNLLSIIQKYIGKNFSVFIVFRIQVRSVRHLKL